MKMIIPGKVIPLIEIICYTVGFWILGFSVSNLDKASGKVSIVFGIIPFILGIYIRLGNEISKLTERIEKIEKK